MYHDACTHAHQRLCMNYMLGWGGGNTHALSLSSSLKDRQEPRLQHHEKR